MDKSEMKELMALLPSNIKSTKEFTTKTKLVIAQLILMNGLDKVKNDGYFFITNQKLVEELGITEKTIIKILRNLEELNFINRKVGKRGEASEYIVNEDVIKSFGNTVKIHCKKEKEITVSNYSNNLESTVINYSNKINGLTLIINDLVKSNNELIEKVNKLEITVLNYSNKLSNYSTDTDTETVSDTSNILNNIEVGLINNPTSNNNNNNSSTVIFNKENNINLKEIGLIENPISENNKEENNLNIKEVGFVDNPTSDKIEIENNNTFQLNEVGMLEKEETSNTPTMNAKFNYYFNDCIKRMGDGVTTIVQLNEKIEKLSTWVRNHNNCYTNEEYTSIQKITLNRYQEIKEQLETESIEDTSIEDEFFNNKEEKVETAKEQLLPNVRIALTKEQLIEDLIEYKNTIINQENLLEAKGYFKQYIKSKDKLIIEFGLTPMVEDIFKELDAKINANKADLTTFNLQDKESIIEDEKTQENAGKQVIIGYKVEEEIPF